MITSGHEAVALTARRPTALVWAGVRDITPMVVGIVPFGLAIGAAAAESSLSTAQSLVSGPALLAGTSQLTAIQMLDAGAAPIVIIVSALTINARFLLYGASLGPWFRDEPLRRRLLLAAPVVDQLHFTCVPRFARGDLDRRGRNLYYWGAACWLVGAWVLAQAVALVAGAGLPGWVGVQVAAPLALVGLLARSTVDRRSILASTAAGVLVVPGIALPFNSGVIVAIAGGIAAGVGFDRARGPGT